LFSFVIFWCQNIGAKSVRKMLMKLTPVLIILLSIQCFDCHLENTYNNNTIIMSYHQAILHFFSSQEVEKLQKLKFFFGLQT